MSVTKKKDEVLYRDNINTYNSDTGGTVSPTIDNPMTYEQYYAEESARLEQERQNAIKQAEVTREMAYADAQTAYARNKSTYGVNAENMAKMGLTGGGYSEYLNAQAYAQQRSDIQSANAQKQASINQANATYNDYISQLNAGKLKYDTEKTNAYNSVLENIQNPTTYYNYTEEGIRALGGSLGWSDEQINSAVDLWKNTKATDEGARDKIVIGDIINDIGNGAYLNESGSAKESWKNIENALYAENVSAEEIARAKQVYEWRELVDSGKVDQATFRKAVDGDEEAIKQMGYGTRNASKKTLKAQDEEARRIATEQLGIKASDIKDVVDVYNDISVKRFGSFAGSGSGGKQDNHIKQIIADAKAGNIQVGKVVDANLGMHAGGTGANYQDRYVYVGDGLFVKASAVNNTALKGVYKTKYQ
jgi:hypothetical protein